MAVKLFNVFFIVNGCFICTSLMFPTRMRRISASPMRLGQQFKTVEGVSVLECVTQCNDPDFCSGVNYNAINRICELTWDEGECTEYVTTATIGWRAYIYCKGHPQGMVYENVTQSSEEENNKRPASLAVDGDFNTLSHTAYEPVVPEPWWKLDFCNPVTIVGVTIWNRNDCCYDQLSNLVITLDDLLCGKLLAPPAAGESVEVSCPLSLAGKHLKIQRMEKFRLALTEVQAILVDDDC